MNAVNIEKLNDPLQCLDSHDIISYDKEQSKIEKVNESFEYKLAGQVINVENGIVEVYGFNLCIDKNKIPKDIVNGNYIQFVTSRIDVW